MNGRFAVLAFVAMLSLVIWNHVKAAQANDRADEAASQLLVERAQRLGLETTLATERDEFADLLSGNETRIDSLITELQGARARAATLTRMLASAGGDATADTVWLIQGPDSTAVPTGIGFEVHDGPFRSMNRCVDIFTNPVCRTQWNLDVGVTLLHTVAPDGTLFVTAEPDDWRVRFEVQALEWVPPRPHLLS